MRAALLRGPAAALALALLSACTMHGISALPASSVSRIAGPFGHHSVPARLYVSDALANTIELYDPTGQHQSPIATIRKGIRGPAGLAVDNAGNLYVANTEANTVTEYPPGGSSPSTTYSSGIINPIDVGVDDNGTLYVANFGSFALAVVEYAEGSSLPSLVIAAPCGCYPIGLALDGAQNLYVAYDNFFEQTVVYEYAPGSTNGVSVNVVLGKVRWEAAGIAFDSSKDMVIANATLPGVQIFGPGQANSKKTFGKQGAPRFLQLDATERHVFVTDTAHGAVDEYDYPSGKLVDVVTSGLKKPYGVAVSPRAPL